jgi:hypothetical protein
VVPSWTKGRGRKLPDHYHLTETTSGGYKQRTEANVRDSDATVIFTLSPKLTGGSLKTKQFAQKAGRPFLHLHPGTAEPVQQLVAFLDLHRVSVLNVAGSRASKEPRVGEFVREIMVGVFAR